MLKSCKGFTLMEILIVLVIIGILTALILPVFQTARLKAKRAPCINNIKQIGAALQLYARDWDGCAPPYTSYKDDTLNWDYKGLVDLRPFNSSPSLVRCFELYGATKEVWFCPIDHERGKVSSYPPDNLVDRRATSYYVPYQLTILRPVHIDNLPVITKENYDSLPDDYPDKWRFWVVDDDPQSNGPYYLQCQMERGKDSRFIFLRFDDSIGTFNPGDGLRPTH